jgi:alkylhydroperoxidase family enzyme
MTGWLGGYADEASLVSVRAGLAEQLAQLRTGVADACPGRTAHLIEARIEQMITGRGTFEAFGPLDEGEQAVVAVAEQFLLDAHGVDDASMQRLGEHFSHAEIVAIMFRMAFADGFGKLRRVLDLSPGPLEHPTEDPTENAIADAAIDGGAG